MITPPGHCFAGAESSASSLASEVPTEMRPVRLPRSSERRDSPPEVAGRVSGVAAGGRLVLTQGRMAAMPLVLGTGVSESGGWGLGEVLRRKGALRISATAPFLGAEVSDLVLPAVMVVVVVLL